MPELRTRDYKALLDLIDIAYSAQDCPSLFQTVCERLEQLIGISSAVWLPIDAHTRHYLFKDHLRFHAPIGPGLLWSLYYAPLHPLAQSHHLQRDMEVFKITDALSPCQLADTEYGRDFQPLVPLFYEMPANLCWQGDPLATFSLHRQRKDGDFTERHRTLFHLLLPHVASAVHAIDLRQSLAQSHDKGVIVQRADGTVQMMNDEARRALDGRPLSTTPLSKIGPEPMVFRTGSGSYRVRTMPIRFGSRGTITILDPVPRTNDFFEKLTGYGLSKREREIVQLVIQGLSNSEIADRLCIAEQTVKDQLHHVFDKMKVRRRSELAAIVLELRPSTGSS